MSTFLAWALDPARTLEERFSIELLVERTRGEWSAHHGLTPEATNYEAERLRKNARRLNPAYVPETTAEDITRAADVLPAVKALDFSQWQDRPLRDVGFLRYCPALEKLHSHGGEVRDWSPVAGLAALEELHIGDQVAEDFRPIAGLAALRRLHLWPTCPWPNLEGFERLEKLDFWGNILVLAAIPRLAGLRGAKIHQREGQNVPLRRVADLPEMPALRHLFLENTFRLDGIERSPRLLNLTLYGYYDDLAPLAGLRELTHLFVSGGNYETMEPLAGLPELRQLTVRREEPQDFAPLAAMPRLHAIHTELAPGKDLELATVNALLPPWEEEFAIDPPRPLAPLRLRVEKKHEAEDVGQPPGLPPRDWGENEGMAKSEAQWFARQVNRRLRALLGREWGKCDETYTQTPGNEHVSITRLDDIQRLPEIIAALRALLATARHPWSIFLCVNSEHRYEVEMDDLRDEDDEEQAAKEWNAEREREDWEDRQQRTRERREFLERAYRYRLRQQLGDAIDPSEFAPPPPPETEELAPAGGTPDEPPAYDLGIELSLYVSLTETSVFISRNQQGLAEMLLEIKAEPLPDGEGLDDP